MQNRFFDILKEQNKQGVTILYSSHVLSEIQRLCTRTAVIKDGEIVTVEEMSKLLINKMKRVGLQFEQANKDIHLPEGAKDAVWQENKLTFRFIGEINLLLEWLATQSPKDITIENPDLESIFMNYYQR
ncbi:MAG: ABC-2 type transport system ATP-binding protein [Sphingobacteriales bacterium]